MSLKSRLGTNGREVHDSDGTEALRLARPHFHQRAAEIQPFGTTLGYPIALDEKVRVESISILNQLLADTMMLRDLYKKHHWQVSGATFHQLHSLFDKHHQEQLTLVDAIAERVQMLGGISIAMAADVAEMTVIPHPPRGREEVPVQLSRLLAAHEMVILQVRRGAAKASALGDDGTNDLLVSNVLRTHEMQVWFLSEHLVSAPLTLATR
jgi:starvation-inducible DNA-binding protein